MLVPYQRCISATGRTQLLLHGSKIKPPTTHLGETIGAPAVLEASVRTLTG
jgi:hypothetical protein